MKKIPFAVVDAFTTEPFAGNPAGVFVDEDAVLSDDEMRRMAGEVHLESAFVAPGDTPFRYRMRYFTGVTEVPFCGHATVAAVTFLLGNGEETGEDATPFVVQTSPGPLSIAVHPTSISGSPFITMGQQVPSFGNLLGAEETAQVLAALGGVQGDLHPHLPIQRVSTGTPWLLVPVAHRDAADRTPADFDSINRISDATDTWGFYVFCVEQNRNNETHVWSRCFAPRAGLDEDPVTGSASGALGSYLTQHNIVSVVGDAPAELTISQGFAGGRGGTAHISVYRKNNQLRPFVRGCAVVVAEGTFLLP